MVLIDQKKCPHFYALFLSLSVFIIWTGILGYKYFHFGYTNWDLAYFSQAMWNLTFRGDPHVSLFGPSNFLHNHSNLIAFLLIPFYRIYPHPLTLLMLKLISFVVSGFIIYMVADERLGRKMALGILLAYFIYPANIFGMLYEFDFESLAPAFLVLMFYFFIKDRWGLFMVTALLVVLIKENLPLIILTFCFYGLFVKKNKVCWGLLLLAVGGTAFVLMTRTSHYIYLYKGFGHSFSEIFRNIFLHPQLTVSFFLHPINQQWYWDSLSPLLFLPLFSLDIVFLVSPIILQHILSSAAAEHIIYFHYMLTITPFLFLAVIYSLARLQRISPRIVPLVMVLMVIACFMSLDRSPIRNINISSQYDFDTVRKKILDKIPDQAAVIASSIFLPELSDRKYLYVFNDVYQELIQDKTWKKSKSSKYVKYVLIDFHDRLLTRAFRTSGRETEKRIHDFLQGYHWKIKAKLGPILLLEKLP